MAKRMTIILALLLSGFFVYAGDVAHFVDMGFSPDGLYYMFGQYGTTDKNYQGYAEIYTVDVKKNDFVSGGVFRTPASASTAGKTGKTVFDDLLKKAEPIVKKYGISTVNEALPLYVMPEGADKATSIEFRDFENDKVTYKIRVTTLADKKNGVPVSSFYLIMDKSEGDTVSKRYLGGSPGVERTNVTGYNIRRILTDKNGKYIVFVVEKEVADTAGTSIRFMVETLPL